MLEDTARHMWMCHHGGAGLPETRTLAKSKTKGKLLKRDKERAVVLSHHLVASPVHLLSFSFALKDVKIIPKDLLTLCYTVRIECFLNFSVQK